MAKKIVVIPGDGIGEEITSSAVQVLKKIDEKFALGLEFAKHGRNLVVLELGIGPRNQLIKAPLMRLVAQEPNASYVTINLGELYIPQEIQNQSFGFDGYLDEILAQLRRSL